MIYGDDHAHRIFQALRVRFVLICFPDYVEVPEISTLRNWPLVLPTHRAGKPRQCF